jgi:hypothetical protein
VGVAAAVYIAGVVDAFVHYNERSLTLIPRDDYLKLKQQQPAASPPAGSPDSPPPASPPTPPAKPTATFFLAPAPGGASIGLAGTF